MVAKYIAVVTKEYESQAIHNNTDPKHPQTIVNHYLRRFIDGYQIPESSKLLAA